jgi:hypothetical protein
MAKWRAAGLDPSVYDDWTGDFANPAAEATTIAKHLAWWEKYGTASPPTFLVYTFDAKGFAVSGLLDEDTYRDTAAALAAAFRAAAPVGGRGDLVFCAFGADAACVISLAHGKSSFADVPERDALERWSGRVKEQIAEGGRRFGETPQGRAQKAAQGVARAKATALPAGAALEALFDALLPTTHPYNPYGEPSKTAMERLLAMHDARVGELALRRLVEMDAKSKRGNGHFYIEHLMTLIEKHRVRDARPALVALHVAKGLHYSVGLKAALTLLALATNREIRTALRASRETVLVRWRKPNAKVNSAAVKKLARLG